VPAESFRAVAKAEPERRAVRRSPEWLRCAIRDTGAAGAQRYFWTVTVFGDHQMAAGRTGELAAARSQAETALAANIAAWREPPSEMSGDA